jgi:transmembrane sensor
MHQDVNNRYSNGRDFRDPDQVQKILDRSANLRVPEGISKEQAFLFLKSRIAEEDDKTLRPSGAVIRRMLLRISSLAAVCLLLFGTWLLFYRSHNNKVVAGRGTHIDYRLPDGTRVTINAGSKIVFNKREFTENRDVVLDGEAFFDVVKGNSFQIKTKHGDIKVLGTSFNVYSRDDLFKVSCISGRISVSCENQLVEITPGQTATIAGKDLLSYQDNNVSSSTSWIKGEYYFENSPLDLIFSEMERQFNVKFVATNIKEKHFTGSFTNKDLGNALEIVCIPMGLKYEIGKNGKIFIKEKNQ